MFTPQIADTFGCPIWYRHVSQGRDQRVQWGLKRCWSVVKSSSRGPGFNFHRPCSGSQPSVTPISEDLMLLSSLQGQCTHVECTGKTPIHIKWTNLFRSPGLGSHAGSSRCILEKQPWLELMSKTHRCALWTSVSVRSVVIFSQGFQFLLIVCFVDKCVRSVVMFSQGFQFFSFWISCRWAL